MKNQNKQGYKKSKWNNKKENNYGTKNSSGKLPIKPGYGKSTKKIDYNKNRLEGYGKKKNNNKNFKYSKNHPLLSKYNHDQIPYKKRKIIENKIETLNKTREELKRKHNDYISSLNLPQNVKKSKSFKMITSYKPSSNKKDNNLLNDAITLIIDTKKDLSKSQDILNKSKNGYTKKGDDNNSGNKKKGNSEKKKT